MHHTIYTQHIGYDMLQGSKPATGFGWKPENRSGSGSGSGLSPPVPVSVSVPVWQTGSNFEPSEKLVFRRNTTFGPIGHGSITSEKVSPQNSLSFVGG